MIRSILMRIVNAIVLPVALALLSIVDAIPLDITTVEGIVVGVVAFVVGTVLRLLVPGAPPRP